MVSGAGMRILAGVSALGTVLGAFIQTWSGWRGLGQNSNRRVLGRNRVRHRGDHGRWLEAHRDAPLLKHVRPYISHKV